MMKVLLVEDDDDSVELIKSALEIGGLPIELETASDGIEAMEYLHSKPLPELVILDLNLPKRNGRQVLADLHASPLLRELPIVLMTTTEWYDDVIDLYPSLKQQCFTKPMRFQDYVNLLGNLRDRAERRELKGVNPSLAVQRDP